MTRSSQGRPYRIILVLSDASRSAEVAVDVAAELAARSGATLHVAAAIQADEAKVDLGELTEMTQPGTREFAAHLQEHVDAVSATAGERWGCAVEAAVLTAEDPADGLTEYQRRVGVDLTVVGVGMPDEEARDGVDLTRRLAYDVEGRLPCPLLLVPGTGPAPGEGSTPGLPAGKLVVAIVGPYDTTSDAAVPAQAATFAEHMGSDLLLVDSVPSGRLVGQDRVDPALVHPKEGPPETRERLRAAGGSLRASGMNVGHEVVEDADAHAALIRLLRARAAGTIAVGPEARVTIERLLNERGAPAGAPGDTDEPFAVLVCPVRATA